MGLVDVVGLRKPRVAWIPFGALMLAGAAFAMFLIYSAARNLDASEGLVDADDEIVQRFVCERSHTNFARGYRHAGIYVDREGGVYRFSVRSTALPRTDGSSRTEAEMDAKYGPGSTRVRTVPREELLAMFRLIRGAAAGRYSPRVSAGADRGALVSACYLIDAERYREVVLDVKGDWEYRNLTSEAQKLTAWLESLERSSERQ
jgi:hypothetical protein